jgi:hypothetical protein
MNGRDRPFNLEKATSAPRSLPKSEGIRALLLLCTAPSVHRHRDSLPMLVLHPLRVINQDVDSYNGSKTIEEYRTQRPNATPEALQITYQAMLVQQQIETEKLALYRAAADAARLAEWEFHNAVLAMKEVVKGQFGSDSNEAQSVGLKKKSDRKRPTRPKGMATAS